MGVFLQVMGGITIAVGLLAAVGIVAFATPLSMAMSLGSAVVWLIGSVVSGCTLIALGQIHDRTTAVWNWMRSQPATPGLRPEAPIPQTVQPAGPAVDEHKATFDPSGAMAGRAALLAQYEQTKDQGGKKD